MQRRKKSEEEEGNLNTTFARQELPFLTLPSVQQNERRGGGEDHRERGRRG